MATTDDWLAEVERLHAASSPELNRLAAAMADEAAAPGRALGRALADVPEVAAAAKYLLLQTGPAALEGLLTLPLPEAVPVNELVEHGYQTIISPASQTLVQADCDPLPVAPASASASVGTTKSLPDPNNPCADRYEERTDASGKVTRVLLPKDKRCSYKGEGGISPRGTVYGY